MSRKFTIQKRQIAGFGGLGGMITTYPHYPHHRPVSRPAPARRRSPSRRVTREGQWHTQPLPVIAAVGLLVLVSWTGWLGWQVQSKNWALAQEKTAQDNLARTNRDLSGQRDRLLARDYIVNRAAKLGLYPARPDQVRKIGGGSAAG